MRLEIICKASIEHQLSLKNVNRKLNFYSIFKTDSKKAECLDRIKTPEHKSAISKLCFGIIVFTLKQGDTLSLRLLSI